MKRTLMLLLIVATLIPVFSRPPNPDELTFAVLPRYSKLEIMGLYAPIIGEIKKATGKKVKLKVAKDFDEHTKWIKSGEIDISYQNPVICALAMDKNDILVTAVKKGEPVFRGVVIAMKNSPLKNAEDCKGKRLGIISWTSGGGYLSQYIAFQGEGIDMKTDIKTKPAKGGKVNKLFKQLKKGTFDAICVRETDTKKADKILGKDNYKVIMVGEDLPNWGFCARNDLDNSIKRKLTTGFLTMPEKSKSLQKIGVDSWTPADKAEFEPILYILDEDE